MRRSQRYPCTGLEHRGIRNPMKGTEPNEGNRTPRQHSPIPSVCPGKRKPSAARRASRNAREPVKYRCAVMSCCSPPCKSHHETRPQASASKMSSSRGVRLPALQFGDDFLELV
jgi:hypothetical protein